MQTKTMTIPQYISAQAKEIQPLLKQMHEVIRKAAPKAEEGFAYGMPSFKLEGKPLVYFAAFKGHLGFYPTPNSITAFKDALEEYSIGKGCIRFPYDKPLPISLVRKIVMHRAKEIKKK